MTPGIKFSSGRLGHMWPAVNGVAVANKDKSVFCLGSDGSQMEGNDAEAARLAVSENLNVKLIVDDNDVYGTCSDFDFSHSRFSRPRACPPFPGRRDSLSVRISAVSVC